MRVTFLSKQKFIRKEGEKGTISNPPEQKSKKKKKKPRIQQSYRMCKIETPSK